MKKKNKTIMLEIGGYAQIEIHEYEEYDVRLKIEKVIDENEGVLES